MNNAPQDNLIYISLVFMPAKNRTTWTAHNKEALHAQLYVCFQQLQRAPKSCWEIPVTAPEVLLVVLLLCQSLEKVGFIFVGKSSANRCALWLYMSSSSAISYLELSFLYHYSEPWVPTAAAN